MGNCCHPLPLQLYVTQDMGATWTHLSDHVDKPFDYQWSVQCDRWTAHMIIEFISSNVEFSLVSSWCMKLAIFM